MTRKIVIFTERTEKNQTYLVDFRQAPEIYQYLPDIYIFLQSKARFYKIKNDAVGKPHQIQKNY